MRLTGEQRREQILDVTKAIVGQDGFHAVSIDRVAREAGITRPVVYGHFDDLGGLLTALVDREGARALSQLTRLMPSEEDLSADPIEVLLGALHGYLEAARADPVTWRLVLMPPEGAPEILRERIALGRGAAVAVLEQLARPHLPAGDESASPDPELTARMMSLIADEAARLVLTDPDRYPIERLLAHARWVLAQIAPALR